ncbi:uncharacterized protein [Lolium perenne]|uniref:uncharacterized protein n=1 Tax=Lolium perenne TaxID=4522 RepID=UPI0021F5F2FE|nr:uncharacterized protein LOC127299914 [Lolium perenne]
MAAALKLVPASHFFLFQCTSNPTRSDPQPSDPVPTGPRPVSPPACSPPSVRQAPIRCSAFASSRIGSRSGVVRYDKFSGCSSTSFNRYEDMLDEDDVSKVTLPAWPGQGYGRR